MKKLSHWFMAHVASVLICMAAAPTTMAQEIQFANPIDLSAPNGLSHVIVVNRGKLVLISGQVSTNKEGKALPATSPSKRNKRSAISRQL